MIEWLRKNNKRLLAIIGVFLMIAFIIPTMQTDPTRDTSAVVAHVGDNTPLRAGDVAEAQHDYQVLTRGFGPQANLLQEWLYQRIRTALGQAYGPMFGAQMAQQIAPQMAIGMARQLDPVHFMLLLHEAREMGIRASEDQVETLVEQLKTVPGSDAASRRQAIGHMLMVFEAFDRIANAPKVSPAAAVHQVAGAEQQVSLQMVDFKAGDFRSDVPSPTRQQLQEFFDKYKAEIAEANPFGVGYRYPNRVKIEYMVIRGEELKKKIGYDEIYKYYKDHPEEFPVTQPATQPATTQATTQAANGSTTRPATQPAVAAATRPKEPPADVREKIHNLLTNQAAAAVAKAAEQIFKADWPVFREAARAAGTTVPVQPPQTSQGVPFHTTEYLERVRNRISKNREARETLPQVNTLDRFLSQKELAELPGIGQSTIQTPRGPLSFAEYVINNAAPFLTQEQLAEAQEGQVLRLYQTSVPFHDRANYYIFRVTAVDPAHPADDIDPLVNQVRDDWVTMQAYEMAKQAAQKYFDSIKAKNDLAAATRPTTRPVLTTGLFSNNPREEIASYPLPPAATQKLIEGGFKLLAERLRNNTQSPSGLIELPRAHAVVVAQLQDAKPAERDESFPQMITQMQAQQRGGRTAGLLQQWFNPKEIEARANYRPASGGGAPAPKSPTRPPGGPIPGL